MSEFTVIETQEALDSIIKERLARQKEKYADYDEVKARNAELEQEVVGLKSALEETKGKDQQISDLQAQIASFETASLRARIAAQYGVPFDLADRLIGSDEESIKQDAERLVSFLKPTDPIPPLKDTEPPVNGNGEQAALAQMLNHLTHKGE